MHEKARVEEAALGGSGELDCVESLREPSPAETVQAEAEVSDGRGPMSCEQNLLLTAEQTAQQRAL